ncbi:uncharacterized protein METZ01_LOCUS107869 [marine metagenome]|uniref:Uncharacterized protein n=1 Tax=marine metagenome TaxID=408172 RepID=A0A381WR96_9ZZZZ
MIKALFFDFYNTLVYFFPKVEDIQLCACKELGLSVTKEGLIKGYKTADSFFNLENSRVPISNRPEREKKEFFAVYEKMILEGAGLTVSLGLATQAWELTTLIPRKFRLFGDVKPTLRDLKQLGLILGIITNLNQDMDGLLDELGLDAIIDVTVTSREVGVEKPHPSIFLHALDKVGISAQEAIHVGDQFVSDAQGAKAVGIKPVLIVRDFQLSTDNDVKTIRTMGELLGIT